VTRIVLAQCTAKKRDGRHRAKDLYDDSTYFRKQRAYARAKGDYWLILSAEYGLVDLEILGGRSYADPLVPELESLGYDVVEPLCGLGIGERMAKLNELTEEVNHATLHG